MYDIITIGSAVVDAFVKSRAFTLIKSDKFATGIGECFAFGSKIDVDKLVLSTGGGATNAATTFARLGFKTACLAHLGQDFLADSVGSDLEQEGVASKFLLNCSKHHTGFSVLLLGQEGERTVLVYRGASEHCHDDRFAWGGVIAKWFYVGSLGGHLDEVKQILSHAKKQNAKVAWNPGTLELQHGWRVLAPLLSQCDIVFMNKEEAALATAEKDAGRVLEKLASSGTTVVISDGPRGAEAVSNGQYFFVRSRGIKALSRTGAGDAFASGTVAGLARQLSLAQSLQLGVINAESVIQHIGAKAGILKTMPRTATLNLIKVKTKAYASGT